MDPMMDICVAWDGSGTPEGVLQVFGEVDGEWILSGIRYRKKIPSNLDSFGRSYRVFPSRRKEISKQ